MAKRINFDNQTLEDYSPGDNDLQDAIDLNTAKDEWTFQDRILELDYTLKRQ